MSVVLVADRQFVVVVGNVIGRPGVHVAVGVDTVRGHGRACILLLDVGEVRIEPFLAILDHVGHLATQLASGFAVFPVVSIADLVVPPLLL